MRELKDETNWEDFLDNFFNFYYVTVEKKEYFGGVTMQYTSDNIFVRCELNSERLRIKKLEFGRLNKGWIKGTFINDERAYLTFLQESLDGENGDEYTIDYSSDNKGIVYNFLQIPCEQGWTESEFKLDKDKYYKVIVDLGNKLSWEISLMDSAKQDLPLFGDKLDVWMNVRLGDAFWNNSRRNKTELKVLPMSEFKKTNAQQK